MSTEQHESDLIRSWLDESYEAERDPRHFLDHLLDEVPTTPQQRRRWWHLPHVGRARAVPTASDTTEYQPSPIPASNGHTPTVIGRTTSMFSPVKAITAGALVFALGGAFLIAQPFGQQSSVPSVTTEGGYVEPIAFTGTWNWSSNVVPEETVTSEGVSVTLTGGVWNHVAAGITDPRFDGDVTVFPSSTDHYGVSGDNAAASAVAVWSTAWRVENEDGAWQGEPTYSLDFHDTSGVPYTAVFHGEGAYEGLTAVVELELDGSRWDLRGLIFDGGLPPDPQPRPLE